MGSIVFEDGGSLDKEEPLVAKDIQQGTNEPGQHTAGRASVVGTLRKDSHHQGWEDGVGCQAKGPRAPPGAANPGGLSPKYACMSSDVRSAHVRLRAGADASPDLSIVWPFSMTFSLIAHESRWGRLVRVGGL